MSTLRRIREGLGFKVAEVAAAAGWSPRDLRRIESDDDPEADAVDRLTDLYGVDVDAVLSGEISLNAAQPAATLLKARADDVDADTRFTMAEAATVAREIRELERELGYSPAWDRIVSFPEDHDIERHPSAGGPERLARRARNELRLPDGPIGSVWHEVLEPLRIAVLWADLSSEVDAFAMASPELGGVIVANRRGAHMANAFGRRVTWAHELCHLLFDRQKMQDLRKFCAVAGRARGDSRRAAIERRARAFAAYFLVPREAARARWASLEGRSRQERVRAFMEHFGIGYEASRSHLDNLELLDVRARVEGVRTEPPERLERADPGAEVPEWAEEAGVSPLRGGRLLELIQRSLHEGILTESRARELLRLRYDAWLRLRSRLTDAPLRWSTSAGGRLSADAS